MKGDVLYRMGAMLSVALGLVLCSCQAPQAVPYTPRQSPTPSIDCAAAREYLTTNLFLMKKHASATRQWATYTGEKMELLRLRDLTELSIQVGRVDPPREARAMHEAYLQRLAAERHAAELMLAYYRTKNDKYWLDAGVAEDRWRELSRKHEYAADDLFDLYESHCIEE